MKNQNSLFKFLLVALALFCMWPPVPSALGLFLGLVSALTFGNPFPDKTKKLTPKFLTWSVMGLGAGMNLKVVALVGLHGIGYTVVGISATILLGTLLGRILKTTKDTSLLVTVGTAICGGSAIAAVAPVIRAKSQDVSISLATVFVLNAIALFIFPHIGHAFNLSQTQFGLWAALAIHDTSSVVGASMQYGAKALEVGTTVKLARALWIVPVTAGISWLRTKNNNEEGDIAQKPKKPWFILGFLIAAAVVTFIPALAEVGHAVEFVAKRFLVLTLFLIGANLNRETLKTVGLKPIAQGFVLWIIIASATLAFILAGLIS